MRANFRCGSHPERGFQISRYYTFIGGQADGGNIFRCHATPDNPEQSRLIADSAPAASSPEQLGINDSERLEFQRIIAWVQQNHRGLFARESRESCIGFDYKSHLFFSERLDERIPLIHLQHDTKMRYRNRMPVNRIAVCAYAIPILARGSKMADQLMAIKIEIHPGVGTASFRAAEQAGIEITCRRDIGDLDGEVKRWHVLEGIGLTGQCLALIQVIT